MPVVLTNHADGSAMTWTSIAANMTALRNWCNAVPVADVAASAIRREHLVRPVIQGFPLQGSFSTLQAVYSQEYGTNEHVQTSSEWGATRRRIPFNPTVNDGVDEHWYLPLSRTIRLPRECDVEVHASFMVRIVADVPRYPDGAGGPLNAARGGFFSIHYRSRTTGVEAEASDGTQHTYPPSGAGDAAVDRVHVSMVETLAAGVWDLMLVYHRGSSPTTLHQIDVTRAHLSVEVL